MKPGLLRAWPVRAPVEPVAPVSQARYSLAALAAATLPFFLALPPWVAGGALVIIAWRALLLGTRRPLPGMMVRLPLLALVLVAVVASFRAFGGATAGGAFLVVTAALKALESRTRRDFRIVALACWLLLGVVFLLDKTLPLALYAIGTAWLSILALLDVNRPIPWKARFRQTGRLLAASLPVTLALFVIFPRLPAPLFRFGAPRLASVSGLADRLSPGSIAALAQSNAIAFRVHFHGPVPAPGLRYFRGPVLERFNGRSWLPGRADIHAPGTFAPAGKPIRYRVLERANGTPYLFALALPERVSTAARLTGRYELIAPHRLWNDTSYTGVSFPHYTAGAHLSRAQRAANLELPAGIDPRGRALARRWRRAAASPAAVVRKALAWFHDEPFYYTLEPGRLHGPNQVDTFLFDTRRGFCEHYASAFAFLMRAAGIPARVVTGYAGGSVNPYDGWLVLRQSNAHAWDEVWLQGRGWVRVDPTSMIPPQRIESSAANAAASGTTAGVVQARSGFYWQVRDLWDAVNTAWTEYVVGYGSDMQSRLLSRMGLGKAGPLATALLMAALALMAGAFAVLAGLVRWRRVRDDPAQRIYLRWCRRLARAGLSRRPSEGPLDFAARISREAPAWRETAQEITGLYCAARYGGDPAALDRLRSRIRRRNRD